MGLAGVPNTPVTHLPKRNSWRALLLRTCCKGVFKGSCIKNNGEKAFIGLAWDHPSHPVVVCAGTLPIAAGSSVHVALCKNSPTTGIPLQPPGFLSVLLEKQAPIKRFSRKACGLFGPDSLLDHGPLGFNLLPNMARF